MMETKINGFLDRNQNQKGLSIIEALVSSVIVGIGFVAIFQMVNYSVNSINVSGERTKATYLVSMIAEGMVGYRDSVGGISKADEGNVIYIDGQPHLKKIGSDPDKCKKFAEYYKDLGTGDDGCGGGPDTEIEKINISKCADKKEIERAGYQEFYNEDDPYNSGLGHAAGNKINKWKIILDEDQVLKCKSADVQRNTKDFKTIKMFEQCAWSGTGYACDLNNSNVLDSAMYLGRIQINLNGGKKRKYLYFQADFRPKMNDGGG